MNNELESPNLSFSIQHFSGYRFQRRYWILFRMEQRIELAGVDRIFGKLAFAELQFCFGHRVIPSDYLHGRSCLDLCTVDFGKQPQPLGSLFAFCSFDHSARVSRRRRIRYRRLLVPLLTKEGWQRFADRVVLSCLFLEQIPTHGV